MKPGFRAILSIAAVFLSGLVIGIYADRLLLNSFGARPPHNDKAFVAKFTRDLDLSAEQQAQLKVLLGKLREQHNAVWRSGQPEFNRIREEFRKNFSAVLTPEQQTKFTAINKKRDEEMEKH
jgi:Spy/CpxP family protein refolding chaperone